MWTCETRPNGYSSRSRASNRSILTSFERLVYVRGRGGNNKHRTWCKLLLSYIQNLIRWNEILIFFHRIQNYFQSNFKRSVQEKNYVFACDGKTFGLIRDNDRALLDRIVQRGKIFARMLPDQKIHLIECMKDLG